MVPTVVSWSESYYYSYRSTEIITVTTLVPCPVYTSYTTVTQCESCGCPGCGPGPGPVALVCSPKTCSAQSYDIIYYESTAYGVGEYAPASASGGTTTYIAANQCSQFASFVPIGYAGAGISACGDQTPPPAASATCVARFCVGSNGQATSEPFGFTEYASVLLPGTPYQLASTPASLCQAYTTYNIQTPTPACGGVVTSGNSGTCGTSIVTYTYTTNGASFVVVTPIPQHCGPFSLSGSGSNLKPDGATMNWLFWLWSACAALSGIGMIVL